MKPDERESKLPTLETLTIQLPNFPNEIGEGILERKDGEVYYEGKKLKVGIEIRTHFVPPNNSEAKITIGISNEKNEKSFVIITVKKHRDNTCTATVNVKNEIKEAKGIGRKLWETALAIIQKMVNQTDTNITHQVIKRPNSGLNKDKWDELFLPLLKQHGYTMTVDKFSPEDCWKKVYTKNDEL